MLNQPVFINQFQKGAEDSANLGIGTMLGVETYSVKGVARLTKDTTKVSGSIITDLPIFATSHTIQDIFCQGDTGKVYRSIDSGTTWTDITDPLITPGTGKGRGLIFYQGYLFAFFNGGLYYCVSPFAAANWAAVWQTGLTGTYNFPFLFPNDGNVYFGNGNKVGKFGFGTASAFNPAGSGTVTMTYTGLTGGTFSAGDTITNTITGATATIVTDNGSNSMTIKNIVTTSQGGFFVSNGFTNGSGISAIVASITATDYFYTASAGNPNGLLPTAYEVRCISYLPNNFLELGTVSSGIGNGSQIADIIPWNPTLSTYETPLALFSQAAVNGGGINQIINRNNVIYAVTGGNHAVFSTNGTSFNLVDDVSLMMTSRIETGLGKQSTAPLFINQYPSAIAVMGNKILTGTSTSISSQPTGYGSFPLGVWSIAFLENGHATQCEFPISTGTIIAHQQFNIGLVYPVSQSQVLIGWQDGTSYGMDKSNFTDFQQDASVVQIESQMMEIGTPLEPAVVTTIQLNLVRSLMDGQTISVYWRNAFDQNYELLKTFTTADGDVQNDNSLKITSNDMGAIKFLQLKIEMSTGSPNQAWSPELRTVIITGK